MFKHGCMLTLAFKRYIIRRKFYFLCYALQNVHLEKCFYFYASQHGNIRAQLILQENEAISFPTSQTMADGPRLVNILIYRYASMSLVCLRVSNECSVCVCTSLIRTDALCFANFSLLDVSHRIAL